ncbi:MAG: hypothetical protein QX203_09815, partial [Methylococcaceae bacterium]
GLTIIRRSFFMPEIVRGALSKKHPQHLPTIQAQKSRCYPALIFAIILALESTPHQIGCNLSNNPAHTSQ